MNILEETKYMMKKYNITASKDLGQNFLIDEEVISNIVKGADISNKDVVIEIGPGLGTLTEKLLMKAKKVICVELDTKMVKILQERFMLFDNIEIINEDILKLDIQNIINENKEYKIKVVANLPYYITTPIIMKLLEEKYNLESITVMIQKEVADRLCAKTGSRSAGAITYAVEYYTEAKELFSVPNTSFIPMPKVESEVINLKPKENNKLKQDDEKKLFEVIKYAFMQRRKTLINALQNTKVCENKEKIKEILKELGINEKIRGEALSLQDFINIASKL